MKQHRSTVRAWASSCSLVALSLSIITGLAGCSGQDKELTARVDTLTRQLDEARAQLQRLDDVKQIEKLTRTYGYYIDKGLWSQVVDLFARDGAVQMGGAGIFKGRKGVDQLFAQRFGSGIGRGAGQDGLPAGVLFNHPQFQGVVDVDPDGKTAKGRWRTLAQVAWFGRLAIWNEGVYENEYVKEDGIWKFRFMKFYPTYFTEFDKGWAKQGVPDIGWKANTPDPKAPPDELSPPEVAKGMYPNYYVPPFHYSNPVTGKAIVAPAPAMLPNSGKSSEGPK